MVRTDCISSPSLHICLKPEVFDSDAPMKAQSPWKTLPHCGEGVRGTIRSASQRRLRGRACAGQESGGVFDI